MTVERDYVADRKPDGDKYDPLNFTVIYDPSNEDQPWAVASDEGYDTHHTLDQVLFWELIMGRRHISEKLRARITEDFQSETLSPDGMMPRNQTTGAA